MHGASPVFTASIPSLGMEGAVELGFEAYILADDDEDGPAEVYRHVQDDDSGVLNVSASFNALSIVLRDEGLMRFVKYVSSAAPGSRWDVSAVMLPVDDDEKE